jgi:hypothetical protein
MEFGRDLMLRRGEGAAKGSSARGGIGRQAVASIASGSAKSLKVTLAYLKGKDAESKETQEHANSSSLALYT